MDMATVTGSVAYAAHWDKIEAYIDDAAKRGAKLLLSGERPQPDDTKNGDFVPHHFRRL